MKTLKGIDPMSAAKMAAVLGIIWGLVVGVSVFAGLGIEQYMGRFYTAFQSVVPTTDVTAIVTLPIMYAITGFVCTYIFALVYNFVADKIGGVKIDLK